MKKKLRYISRQVHLWFALVIIIPSVIVISTGLLLQVKKQSDWIQPPTQKGLTKQPTISFNQVFEIVKDLPELEVSTWEDINRLDVRPSKGMLKVLANNDWEAQLDAQSGAVLYVAYRRSDTIEAIHDGSWFAESAKLWIFLPAGAVLLFIWLSGSVMLFTTLKSRFYKNNYRQNRKARSKVN